MIKYGRDGEPTRAQWLGIKADCHLREAFGDVELSALELDIQKARVQLYEDFKTELLAELSKLAKKIDGMGGQR